MVQGSGRKISNARPSVLNKKSGRSAKVAKQERNKLRVKKGAPTQLPKHSFREEALMDRELSKEIGKASERKVAAKVIQDGGKITTKDILQEGKELNRELKRKLLTKKVGRVKAKLNELEEKAEAQGLI
jgi:hypothetical protein